eukprot:364705-Chlamydomonas_euryale.AAC.17
MGQWEARRWQFRHAICDAHIQLCGGKQASSGGCGWHAHGVAQGGGSDMAAHVSAAVVRVVRRQRGAAANVAVGRGVSQMLRALRHCWQQGLTARGLVSGEGGL